MKLYKYTSFELGKVIIETSQIALSKPEWFNDPFDCVPVLDSDEMQRAIDLMNGYLLDKQIFHMLQELKGNLKKFQHRVLISWALLEYRFWQYLAKGNPSPYRPVCTFKRINKLFEAFEKHGKLTPEEIKAKEKLSAVQAMVEHQAWDVLADMMNMRDNMYIACLSAVYDSILMWSYYGQEHRGICVELEMDENSEYLSKVQYCTERPTVQLEKMIRNMCGQMFAQMDMSNAGKEPTLLSLVVQPYITKAKEWEHEREYRLIYLEEAFEKEKIEKQLCPDGKERGFYPAKITKVIFGAAMSDKQKAEIRSMIPSGIEVVEMKISDTKYELLSQ